MPSKQFTAADRTALAEVGKVLSQHAEAFGAESLARLFLTHPASKIYFSEFTDYSAAGPRVRVHGAKVLGAVAKAIGHLDDLHTHLEPLAAKHGHDLVVDPQNFPTFVTTGHLWVIRSGYSCCQRYGSYPSFLTELVTCN
ncbi:hemoglobin subunit alpha-like isoform X5 [Carcharodon carcharias]|uniref:hemoglobin subunit alpha-like isoform X5 n=1 Tax=Carcharodon carcharias TaxID=13397 RepID=UPI001B7F1AA1|nr:hemoglobin subunit alpha-like isoform X5 [Carcharodon carcharias]